MNCLTLIILHFNHSARSLLFRSLHSRSILLVIIAIFPRVFVLTSRLFSFVRFVVICLSCLTLSFDFNKDHFIIFISSVMNACVCASARVHSKLLPWLLLVAVDFQVFNFRFVSLVLPLFLISPHRFIEYK